MMLCLLSPLGLSSGYGLSPRSCLLPHMSPTAPSFTEHDELLGSRNLGDPTKALLQAPMQNVSVMPSIVSLTTRRASVTMHMPTGRMTRRGALLGAGASLAAAALPLAGLPRAALVRVALILTLTLLNHNSNPNPNPNPNSNPNPNPNSNPNPNPNPNQASRVPPTPLTS